jgi:RNA polymerase sigma factor (sigma-70 family)
MSDNSLVDDQQFKDELNSLEDTDIIKRILKGEHNLYSLIIRKYNQRLYRVGLSIVKNESDVQEIMQTSYIKAYENLSKFRFESGFSTWLTKILVNESFMHLKKKDRSVAIDDLNLLPQVYNAADMQTPLTTVLNIELKTILEHSILQLPDKYRTVFIMREMENISVAETMECLALTEANVKVRLNRAKVMLRKTLRSYLRDEEILQLYDAHCDRMVETVMAKIIAR